MSEGADQKHDPLVGQREAVNAGKVSVLTWTDRGKGCPVKVGDIFKLRTCHIEITRVQRTRSGRNWHWVANFSRYRADRPQWLARRGGTTTDIKQAMNQEGDVAAPVEREQDRSHEPVEARQVPHPITGQPAEASMSHEEIAELPTSVAARARYEEVHHENTQRRLQRSLIEEIREAHLTPTEVDRVREALAQVAERRKVAA